MLPSDELIIKATSMTTQVQALIPQIWAARLEKNLRRRAVLQQSLMVFNDLMVPGAGDTVYVPILPDLAAASAQVEGSDITFTPLNTASSVALVPSEAGMGIEVTRKALDRMKYDGIAEILDRLSYSMSLLIEGRIAALYNAAVPGTTTVMTNVFPNGKSAATLLPDDLLNDRCILDAVTTLENVNNVPFEDGTFVLYVTPGQWASMLQDTNIRQDLRWAESGHASNRLTDGPIGMQNGERGTLHGVRIVVTNHIKQVVLANGTVANQALLTAPRWAAIAYKRKPEVVVDPTLYDFGRRRRFGVLVDYDVQLVHAERAVVVQTA